ncbi:hypothetical protein ACP70R_047984 [Stipagrostis hirtigluma subsp. patula]
MDAAALNNPRVKALLEFRQSNLRVALSNLERITSRDNVALHQLREERTKALANQFVAKLTDACWDKCITGSIGSSFSRSETSCLSNCTKRYAELKILTMQKFAGGR